MACDVPVIAGGGETNKKNQQHVRGLSIYRSPSWLTNYPTNINTYGTERHMQDNNKDALSSCWRCSDLVTEEGFFVARQEDSGSFHRFMNVHTEARHPEGGTFI